LSSRPLLIPALAAVLATAAGQSAGDPLTVFFIDPTYSDYSGDAMLVLTPDGRSYLVDGGEKGSDPPWDCGETRVLPLLDSLGITHLDGIVATHPHSDHIGGLLAVLENVEVDVVWDSGWPYSASSLYEQFLEAVEESGAAYVVPRRGDAIDWGPELEVTVLHPEDPLDPSNMNNASLVLLVSYQDVSFLLAGDLETEGGEDGILDDLASGDIESVSAQVLKVGHHGSYTSTSTQWLAAVSPLWAAIEVGAGNPYGHPHGEVLSRLYGRDIDVFRTDLLGTFFISTDGDSLWFNSLPEEEGPSPDTTGALMVFPSPCSDHATFAWGAPGDPGDLAVFNLLGETVREWEGAESPVEWNLALPDGWLASPGLYAAVVETPEGGRWLECFAVVR
jgi:beta-lactamase superfamily II metal-dependent hydrolase